MSASAAASPSVASDSHHPPVSPTARAGRLRRLSQLRAYTQSHLTPHPSSSSASSSSSNQRSYRNSLTRAVGLPSPFFPTTTPLGSPVSQSATRDVTRSVVPESEGSRSVGSSSSSSDLRGQTVPSETSRSTPSHEPPSSLAELVDQSMSSAMSDGLVSSIPDADNGQDTTGNSPSRQISGGETAAAENQSGTPKPKQKATIRFFAYQDPHHTSRPSLPFSPMTRTLPSEDAVIRVGRYSERDGVPISNPTEPSDAPIGFKSKVVSRKHCEFSFVNGQWHIKDVGSSSGTFLNRMRLSQPNMMSRLYAVRDGDIVQLGIDFRGGEEMIFRCVRIRIECNRSWQQRPNEFNKNTESLIRSLGKGEAATDFEGCRECSICLGSVLRPYQCLFMAACAHVWHYKCIRRLIHTPDYPMFQCPNCRAWTDLSAEVDDTNEYDDATGATNEPSRESEAEVSQTTPDKHSRDGELVQSRPPQTNGITQADSSEDGDLAAATNNMDLDDTGTPRQEVENLDSADTTQDELAVNENHSANIPIPSRLSPNGTSRNSRPARRSDAPGHIETFEDNPMTPRNDSGPLAFDGRAGRL